MPNWTKDQQKAIFTNGTNIIVSAGAGSGKTAVLSERVIEKLKSGIKINELLILTFTNAAAGEMKERIRKKISKEESLKDNLDYIESSYITTFDSFTLSLVKKYSYLLNVSPNINVIDNGIKAILKEDILDEVFNLLYESKDIYFEKLINDFCLKNDTNLKKSIMNIINQIDLISDKEEFLNNYLEKYFGDDHLNNLISEYLLLIENEKSNIEENLFYISELDYFDYYEKLTKSLEYLIKSKTYNEYKKYCNVDCVRRPKESDDLIPFKSSIDESIKNIKYLTRFDDFEEIKDTLLSTKEYVKSIIDLIKIYYSKINEYKKENDLYEFNDIEIMAISLLKNNSSIRNELKMFYKEIMVDEYQDTNDLQEEFISLIANDNVYMVGDIKQSIYGFRNANPMIFKNKYDNYASNNGGIKIDLLQNFRSRKEVIDGINGLFNLIMDDAIGGANYQKDHQMNSGNQMYIDIKANQDYDLEILNYQFQDKTFSNEEIECFTIINDIKNKIKNHYQVIDKDTNELRDVTYRDFCIIMDRGTGFDNYKKIFEYSKVPLAIHKDQKLTSEVEIMLINNLIGIVLLTKNKLFDINYKYYFISIARSFLFEYDDNKIFNTIKNTSYEDTDIYKISLNISENLEILNITELIDVILEKFGFYEKLIKIGNIEKTEILINNLLDVADNLVSYGFTINEFKDYLEKMIEKENEISYKINENNSNSVKIMNIHKSKGLEFPICYFSGFKKEFNSMDIKDRFLYHKNFGIITPYFKEGIGATILKDLLKNYYIKNDISEKIRLLYVALTRAKEKIIIVAPLTDKDIFVDQKVDFVEKLKYRSFLDILNSVKNKLLNNIKNVDINKLCLTRDYLYHINNQLSDVYFDNKKKIEINNIIIDNSELEEKHASKTINRIISKEEQELLKKGTQAHETFETTNFMTVSKSNPYYKNINYLINELEINKDTNIFKEHEFIYDKNSIKYHGIIDLLLVKDDKVIIVDYKYKNIVDDKYKEQLNVYYNYIKLIYDDKKIETYLYSILDNKLEKIKMNS